MSGNEGTLSTLPFSVWLSALRESERAGAGMQVDCGGCRGCCTSAYFIPIGPDETATLARVPRNLLFPAPGRPKGHFLLAYDDRGHCALFKDDACSIYADRPRACRAYDCRVFAATGLSEHGKPAIAERAGRWRFAFPAEADRRLFEAVRAAARFLEAHAAEFPEGFLPGNATQRAALAIRIHAVFLEPAEDAPGTVARVLRESGAGNTASLRTGHPAPRPPKPLKSPGSPLRSRRAGRGKTGS